MQLEKGDSDPKSDAPPRYFVSSELMIATTLQRHFWW